MQLQFKKTLNIQIIVTSPKNYVKRQNIQSEYNHTNKQAQQALW